MLLTLPETFQRLQDTQTWLLGSGLALGLFAETWLPALRFNAPSARFRHLLTNSVLWLLGALLFSMLLGAHAVHTQFWLEFNGIGLLHLMPLPLWAQVVVGILLIDFGDYVFHRLSHQSRWLWLLHAVHHSDEHLDISTSLRAHPLHVLVSFGWKILMIAALGVPIWIAMLRDALAIPVSQFHHSNLRLPDRLESWLRLLIVTPPVHRLHHSPILAETNANFGSLFPWWDKLLGTFTAPAAPLPVTYGLNRVRGGGWQTLPALLALPWRARRLGQL